MIFITSIDKLTVILDMALILFYICQLKLLNNKEKNKQF